MELKKGYNGPEYYPWYDWAKRYAAEYAFLLGSRDGYFGAQEESFVREMQRRLGNVVIDGKFGDVMAARTGYKWKTGLSTVVYPYRKIWIWTSPGSGANFDQGPSFELGKMCKDILHLNHQPVYFQKGGYLGLLGGDSKFSYVEVTWDQCKSIEWLWDNNKDVQEALAFARMQIGNRDPNSLSDQELINLARDIEFEGHFSGYSQSADGTEDAAEFLFGDPGFVHPGDKSQTPSTGKYRLLRHCVKRIVQFGNPSTPVTGIARKTRPVWLASKVRNINKANDFYAVAPDKIRPLFYSIVIKAETELPFGVRILRLAVPVILQYTPVLGLFGPLGQLAVAGMTGLNAGSSLLTGLFGQAGSDKDKEIDAKLIEMLGPMGILENVPGLLELLKSLPGLQAHGEYFKADIDAAYHHIASFRR